MVTRDPRRFEVWLARLDPAVGSEMQKTRPTVVVSPDGMNKALNTALFCPLTSRVRGWPSRVRVEFGGRDGEVALDQMRVLDRSRLVRPLGRLDDVACLTLVDHLQDMFAW